MDISFVVNFTYIIFPLFPKHSSKVIHVAGGSGKICQFTDSINTLSIETSRCSLSSAFTDIEKINTKYIKKTLIVSLQIQISNIIIVGV